MKKAKKIGTLSVVAAVAIGISLNAFAYGEVEHTDHRVTEATFELQAFKDWDTGTWVTEREDSAKITLTPGATQSDLNFSWYSETKGTPAVKISKNQDMSDADEFDAKTIDIDRFNTSGKTYKASNQVSVKDYFKPNTTYYYSYSNDKTTWSAATKYTTKSADSFQAIVVGDPQIGASGSTQEGTPDDRNIAGDTYNWNKTITTAVKSNPSANLILSIGDQINNACTDADDTKGVTESEYAGYLYPEVLRNMPVATVIGNHESKGDSYKWHYNNPNSSDNLGATNSGSDYYFSQGNVLIISLNSNNRNVAEHRALMKKAIESNKTAKWKIVMLHHDIYGSATHSDSDGANVRILFAPLMDEFGIDVCLNGHDHSYVRSYQIYDGKAISYGEGNTVTNPLGTMYVATGSASGSKVYNLVSNKQYYVAERTNDLTPSYSTLSVNGGDLTIKTFDYNNQPYADTFTIKKNVSKDSISALIAQAKGIDTSKYTEESVKALNDTVSAIENMFDTQEDKGAEELSKMYEKSLSVNSDKDAVDYYSYAQDLTSKGGKNYQRQDGLTDSVKKTTLAAGFSTLLDKTLVNNQAKIQSDELDKAYASLSAAISDLKEVNSVVADKNKDNSKDDNKTTENNKQPSPKTGNNENAAVALFTLVTLGAGVIGIKVKKMENK